MSDVFSEYVTLFDEIEQIPVTARESRLLSVPQRAEAVARVVELVRDRVLPQSDRDCAGREALLDDGSGGALRLPDHDAILAPLEELDRVDPADGARVQELLYRLHAVISGHFSEAEVMLTSMGDDEPAPRTGGRFVRREYARPSAWFG
ncbi:MAG TPA: hypothetical protein VIH85_15070 [Solirubrobacteraceae bacterium]|jgi:hypothetical protein